MFNQMALNEVSMKLAGVQNAASLMREVLADSGDANKVYLSAMVAPAQKRLIEELARANRAKQADVLRAIIDEWCESKLEEAAQ
jgi:hypothetical protein